MIRHRTDIDVLRALAILPVVLFHAGAAWLPGGFVGVDVFFVISGYLITSMIAPEIASGRFSLARFYARRARRILPALLLVLTVTFALGLALLTPVEMQELGKMIIATCAFVSNIALWTGNGYFETADELKPLLMTWSLGIEEQFYIFWPLALMAAVKWRASPKVLVGAVALVSFGLACWGTVFHPKAAFLVLPTRAWELLIGAALALGLPAAGGRADARVPLIRHAISLAGLLLIGTAVVALDRYSGFPAWATLVPCAGAAMLIASGEGAIVNRRLLSSRPFVFIGLISYSLYLWHWPLLSLARVFFGAEGMPWTWNIALIALAFVLAALTWRYVETPFRRAPIRSPRATLARYGTSMTACACIGVGTLLAAGFPSRLGGQAVAASRAESRAEASMIADCANHPDPCPHDRAPRELVVLWGDSHARAISPGVRSWAERNGYDFLLRTHKACPPLLDARLIFEQRELLVCKDFNDSTLAEITANPQIKLVVLAGRWAWYTETSEFGYNRRTAHLVDPGGPIKLSREESRHTFQTALPHTVKAITASGKNVLLIGQVPEMGVDVGACLTRRALPPMYFKWPQCAIPTEIVAARLRFTNEVMAQLAATNNAVKVFLPTDLLCSSETCMAQVGSAVLYADDNHVSAQGALYIGDHLNFDPRLAPASPFAH